MPRRPSPKRPPPRQSPRLSGLARLVPVLHGSLIGLRNLGIGLALIGSVSFLPESLVQTWPEHGQRAIQITRDIRTLLLDVVRETTAGVGSWLSDLDGVDIVPQAAQEGVLRRASGKVEGENLLRQAIESVMSTVEAFERFGIR